MKIQQLDLTVRDLVAGYRDDGEGGVVGKFYVNGKRKYARIVIRHRRGT